MEGFKTGHDWLLFRSSLWLTNHGNQSLWFCLHWWGTSTIHPTSRRQQLAGWPPRFVATSILTPSPKIKSAGLLTMQVPNKHTHLRAAAASSQIPIFNAFCEKSPKKWQHSCAPPCAEKGASYNGAGGGCAAQISAYSRIFCAFSSFFFSLQDCYFLRIHCKLSGKTTKIIDFGWIFLDLQKFWTPQNTKKFWEKIKKGLEGA